MAKKQTTRKTVPRKRKTKKFAESAAGSATQVMLAIIIGAVVASTAVAVVAKSVVFYERLALPVLDDTTVRISTPTSGTVAGDSINFKILAVAARGMFRVELYEYASIPTPPIAEMTGNGPYYQTQVDLTNVPDHSYKTYYAKAYALNGTTSTSEYVHVQIDKCAVGPNCLKIETGDDGIASISQVIPTEPGASYQISYKAKRGSEDAIFVRALTSDSSQELAHCPMMLPAFDWTTSYTCSFTAQADQAKLELTAGEEKNGASTYLYVDDIVVYKIGDGQNLVENGDFSSSTTEWTGDEVSLAQVTPVTSVKPFSPSVMYSVESALPETAEQRIGFWFFKGWPQAHYSWWTKLGEYERPPLLFEPLGGYTFTPVSQDPMKWYSPLTMWVSRESLNPEEFSFSDISLRVTTDKGVVDICVPDVDWNHPLINNTQITGLMVDEHGNTYYSGRYSDPDKLQDENIAKRCACSDGTRIGQCNATGTQVCNADGSYSETDCRTCGCEALRDECREQTDGTFACESVLQPIEIDDL